MARRTVVGNARSFMASLLGNVTGRMNVGAWLLAGTAAYFLWIKPERDAQKEREAMAALRAAENDTHRYVEKQKSVRDLQETDLAKGIGKESNTPS